MIVFHFASRFVAALTAIAVAGCSGGAASSSGPLPLAAAGASALSNDAPIGEPQAGAVQEPHGPWLAANLLYVGNTGNDSITVYRYDAHGDSAPLRVISGSNTGISSPGQLSEDAQGNLYVANGNEKNRSTQPAILVFASGADGNVAPLRTLAGPLTGIHNVNAMTVDQRTGSLFVVDSVDTAGGLPSSQC